MNIMRERPYKKAAPRTNSKSKRKREFIPLYYKELKKVHVLASPVVQ